MSNVKDNLDILDAHNMKDIWTHEGVVYRGNTTLVNQIHTEQYIPSLLAAAVLGLNNTATPSANSSKLDNMWTDIDAQEVFLNTKPTCYLILSKPGLGADSLGEAISKKYNCIHLCPRSIINDEILQNSTTGKCLEFNMRHRNSCTPTSIIPMLKQKVNSPAVKHRGYVISGFPLVTSCRDPYYLIKSEHSEEALYNIDQILFDIIYNLKRKKPKSAVAGEQGEDENNEEEAEEENEEEELEEGAEEQDIAAELPKFVLNTCSDVFYNVKSFYETTQAMLLEQLHELFNLVLQPDVIINITCPDADVITKKYHKYINYKNGQNTVEPFLTKFPSDLRWPTQYTISDYKNPHSNYVFHPKYNCRPPINCNEGVLNQLCNYRNYILPYIEKKIMDFDPRQVIKLDGRTSAYQMMHQVTERLLLMDINAVLIPEPLYITEPPEDFEEFWNMVKESQAIRSNDLSFKRYASPWFNRCPVELKKRQSVIGKVKYAVMLFKHVYLMSSLDNFISFCRNPRPFLKLQYLEPTCRIIVTGTKSTGKTMIAECLSWIFETPVTSFNDIVVSETQKKYHVYAQTIYSEILPVLEDARFIEWQKNEEDRESNLKEWNASIIEELTNYLPLLIESLQYIIQDSSVNKLDGETQEEQADEQRDQEMGEDDKKLKEEQEGQNISEDEKVKDEQARQQQEAEDINMVEEEQMVEAEEMDKQILGVAIETEDEEKQEEEQIISEVPVPDPIFLENFNAFRKRLSLLPIIDSVEDCKTAIANADLTQYAPSILTTTTKKPLLPLLGDEDVTKAISEYIIANELQKEMEPTAEEICIEVSKLISNIDTERQQITDCQELYGKYIIDGFPSDSEFWDLLSSTKLIPDYTIAIMENREVDRELFLHYLNIDARIKNYQEIMLAAKDPLILCKLQTKKVYIPTRLDIKMIVNDLIYDSLADSVAIAIDSTSEDKSDISPEMIASFTESIEKFREDWDNIKLKLEDKSKCFVEVELENKTDVEVLEQVLLKLRQCYFLQSEVSEDDEGEEDENVEQTTKDLLTYNNSQNLCETGIYCPYTFFNYGLLWEGKKEFCLKYDNKVHYFAKEEFLEQFRQDITKYQAYNNPIKKLPRLKICIIGCTGGGLSTLSKRIAMELGLIHIHFADIINYYYMPRHYKNVGRKYENPFTDEPMEDEGVVEFQIDEENPNLLADIFSNEKEMRRIVYNYYERGQPILSMIMHKIIKSLWFTEPFNHTGFVLDGYPRLPQDVEDLIQCNCIPDIVIEIESTSEIGVERIGALMFQQWKSQLKEAKAAHNVVLETQNKIWMSLITKKAAVQLIIEEIFDNCVANDIPQLKKESLSTESFVFDVHPTSSINVDRKLSQVYNQLIEQYPKPTDTRIWEKPEEVHEEINARIEAIWETEFENIQALKDLLLENKINTISIDGAKPFVKVLRRTLAKLNHLRNRSESIFEQTYIITTDIAELLLSQGYCLLSKFGRLCPVYTYENEQIIQNSYKIGRRKGQLFPVIHRAYVYFICGEDNVKKFRTNPLKYICSDNIKDYRPYPLRIAIIGTSKSGKSTLAAKIARRNNLICISRGMALRNVLETMHWTELGANILKKLHNGDMVEPDWIINAVQTAAIDHRAVTYGFILDGFPSSAYEATILADYGLYPTIIFDISADKTVILENSQNEIYYDILKYVPPYSHPFIEYRYTQWYERSYKIRNWIKSDYQNLCSLDGNKSKWQCLQDVNKKVKDLKSEMHSYLIKVATEVVPVKILAISNALFEKNMSSFRNLCPACLRKHILKHSGYPVDKNGVVQYGNKFYWVCTEHIEYVTKFPDYYLLYNADVPEIPAVVTIINPDNVYENGICIVTYAENLPAQILDRGTHKFAAVYRNKTYLFCSEACLNNFLEKPTFYADITIFKGSSWYPRLSLKKLPDLGYLEQTLANILTAACCSVNAVRPKYPGLSIELSALLHIALYLKTHNPRLPKGVTTFYKKALHMYENRSKLILDIGLRMRTMENPFLAYPKCHHGTPEQHSPEVTSSMGSKPSSIASYSSEKNNKFYTTVGSAKGSDTSSNVHMYYSSLSSMNHYDDGI